MKNLITERLRNNESIMRCVGCSFLQKYVFSARRVFHNFMVFILIAQQVHEPLKLPNSRNGAFQACPELSREMLYTHISSRHYSPLKNKRTFSRLLNAAFCHNTWQMWDRFFTVLPRSVQISWWYFGKKLLRWSTWLEHFEKQNNITFWAWTYSTRLTLCFW